MKVIFSQDDGGVKTETKAKHLKSLSAPKGHEEKSNTRVSIVKMCVHLCVSTGVNVKLACLPGFGF